MKELFDELLNAKPDALLLVAGLIFLLIAVVGNIAGKIEPGKIGRIVAGALGGTLLLAGLIMHLNHPASHVADGVPPPSPVRFPANWVVETNKFTGTAILKTNGSPTVEDSFAFTGEFHFDALPQPQAIFDGQYRGKSKTISFKRLTPDNRLQQYDGSLDASDPNSVTAKGGFTHEGVPGTYEWHMTGR